MNIEPDDHDLGLVHDLPRLLGRRRLLRLMGVGGAATLVGCGDDDAGSPSSTADGTTECAPIPEETAGPFPGDGSNGPDVLRESGVVRRDIRSSFGSSSTVAEGIPMTINLGLLDVTGNCTALAGAAVYVWHCDRGGGYSLYSAGIEGENYLRGVQESDENGRVTFESIFPAAYSGRWPHIHFEVYESLDAATSGGIRIARSQVALPEDACLAVYATAGYEQSVTNLGQTSLESDNVFGEDGGVAQLASVDGDVDSGYSIELSIAVDSTAESTPGSDGAPPGAGPGPGGGRPPGGGPPPSLP